MTNENTTTPLADLQAVPNKEAIMTSMTSMTSDALAIAEADAAELRVTIEHLHTRLSFARVEIESHLERIDAADQRVRTLDAALAHEREVGRGLVAQVEALRAESRHHAAIAAQNATISNERDAASARAEKAEADRDRIKREGENRLAYEIELRELHKRGAVQAEEERDAANAEIAKLRAEVAELRARPVLTVEAAVAAAREADWSSAERHDAETVVEAILAALGPVTLPSPDRAEELCRKYHNRIAIATAESRIASIGAEIDRTLGEHAGGRISALEAARDRIATLEAELARARSTLKDAADLFIAIQATDGEEEHRAICDGAALAAKIDAATGAKE